MGIAPAGADVPTESFADGPGCLGRVRARRGRSTPAAAAFCVDVPAGSAQYGVGVLLNGVAVEQGSTYTLAFSASATHGRHRPRARRPERRPVRHGGGQEPGADLGAHGVLLRVHRGRQLPRDRHADEPEGQIAFQLGGFSPDAWTFCLDDVSLSSDVELLPHTSFAESLGPWGLYGGSDPVFADGGVCTTLPGGQSNPWDAGLAFTGIPIEEGQNYVLTFTAERDAGHPGARDRRRGRRCLPDHVRAGVRAADQRADHLHVPVHGEPHVPRRRRSARPAGLPPGQDGRVRVLHHGRLAADHREPAAAVRARDRAARARQPGRLRARGPEARDARDRGDRGAAVGAARRGRRRRGDAGRPRPRARTARPT